MSPLLIGVGVVGAIVTLLSVLQGVMYQASLSRSLAGGLVRTDTVFIETTSPALATLLLLLLQHWIFAIVIALSLFAWIHMGVTSDSRFSSGEGVSFALHQLRKYGSALVIVIGGAILLTLSLTAESPGGPTVWRWYLPALVVGFGVGTHIINALVATAIQSWGIKSGARRY